MKKITLFAFAIAAAFSAVAQNFTATYTFDSVALGSSGLTDPTAVPTAVGITFGSFSAMGTPANPNAGGRFSFTDWATGGAANNNTYSAHTGSVNTAEYYEVTLTPAMGYAASLTAIDFRVQRSGTGIRTYAVRSSADTYTANLSAMVMGNNNLNVQAGNTFFWMYDSLTSGQNGSMISLSGVDYTNFTGPLTFRFYGWNAEAAGGSFGIDTVTFTGSVSGTTGINTLSNTTATVYPNPSTDGLFTVKTGAVAGTTTITVFNIIGKAVYTTELVNSSKEIIDLSNQANGSYFVAIKNDAGTITKKIVINK